MADKSSQLVLNALTQAAAAGPVPWHGTKTAPGLFPPNAVGKQAAQRCREEGLLQPLSPDRLCGITDKGLAYLLSQMSPRQVLEDFVRVLEQREGQVLQVLALARQAHADLEALRANAELVLAAVGRRAAAPDDLKSLFHNFVNGQAPPPLGPTLLALLARWSAERTEDCPLPELFRLVQASQPGLSIGQFHDALRPLYDAGDISLNPWTGPLYALPAPFALLVGHEVAYYARPLRMTR